MQRILMVGKPNCGKSLLFNQLTGFTFPILLAGIGLGGAYGIYAIFAFLSVIFVVKFINETKGKELEQMQG